MANNAQEELEALRVALNKKYGKGAMHKASESAPVNRLPFLQPNLNRATNGGLGFGRPAAFSGDPNCLDAGTMLSVKAWEDGAPARIGPSTIAQLYEEFQPPSQRTYSIMSMLNGGMTEWNRVVDVVDSGEKECLEIITTGARAVTCSFDHKIFAVGGYQRAGDLSLDQMVFVAGRPDISCMPSQQQILSIERVGVRRTYDIKMANPYNNFVADNIVVHNSGKSRIAFELIAQAQQLPYSAERVLLPRIAYHTALSNDTSLGDVHRARHEAEAGLLSDQVDWFRREFPSGADAIYYNAEMQFDPIWAAKIGVDLDRLDLRESVTIEEIAETLGDFYPHVPLHVVDSTSNASSLLEQKQEVGKSAGYGVDARQWKVSLRGSMTSWDMERNMLIMIHQMSTNMKTGGQQMMATRYMNFISRMTILFRHARFLYKQDGVLKELKPEGADKASMSGQVEADGREIIARVEKSTTCRPFLNAGLQWDYKRSNFVVMHELFSAGVHGGIIVGGGPGGWWRVADEEKNIGQGAKAVYARLADDEELRARINNSLMDSTADSL